jgi:hypothetical protein
MCCAAHVEGACRKGNFKMQEEIHEANGGVAVDVITEVHHSANEMFVQFFFGHVVKVN